MQLQRLDLIISALLVTACVSPRVPASLPPELPQTAPAPDNQHPETPSRFWRFKPNNISRSYSSVTQVVIANASVPQDQDTFSTRIYFSLTVNREEALSTITGRINRVQFTPGRKIQTTQPVAEPSNFAGTINAGQIFLHLNSIQAETSPCDNPSSSYLSDLHTGLVSLPAAIQTGSTWVDTVSITSCSGIKLPITVQIIRSYQAQGDTKEDDASFLLINRTEQISFSGNGSQDQHQIQLEGRGTGSSNLWVDSETGALHRSQTLQHMTFTVSASGRQYHFTQEVNQRISPAS